MLDFDNIQNAIDRINDEPPGEVARLLIDITDDCISHLINVLEEIEVDHSSKQAREAVFSIMHVTQHTGFDVTMKHIKDNVNSWIK